MTEKLVWLLFAHVFGDIALQSDWLAQNKGKYIICMVWHSLIWTACVCVAMEYLNCFHVWKAAFCFTGHVLIDMWKCKMTDRFPSWHLYVDQSLHFIQCVIVAL